jgi:formyltetrahydrofolate deformylase
VETDVRVRSAGRCTLDGGHGADDHRAEIGRLLIPCPDRPGIVAAVSSFLFSDGADITESQQYPTNPFGGIFFLRIEFHLAALAECFDDLAARLGELAGRFLMRWPMTMAGQHPADRLIVHQAKTIVFA